MLALNKDGTAVIDLGAGPTRLRRPTLGEFRRLREDAWTVTETAAAALEALSGVDDSDDAAVTTASDRRKLLHDTTAAMDDAWVEWTRDAVVTLGDREAPPAEEWPAWAGTQDLPSKLMSHWRDVPLASGGPPR